MKKTTAILLALLLTAGVLFSFASCTLLSSYEVMHNAIEKTKALDSYEMKLTLDLKAERSAGVSVSLPMEMQVRACGVQSDLPVYEGQLRAGILGKELTSSVYCDNAYAYVDMSGVKIKTALSQGETVYDLGAICDGLVKDLPEDAIKDLSLTTDVSGAKTISMAVSGDVFLKNHEEFLSYLTAAGQLVGIADLSETVSDVTISATVLPDGYVGSYETAFSVTLGADEKAGTLSVHAKAEYLQPGAEVVVVLPAGDDYVDCESLVRINGGKLDQLGYEELADLLKQFGVDPGSISGSFDLSELIRSLTVFG